MGNWVFHKCAHGVTVEINILRYMGA